MRQWPEPRDLVSFATCSEGGREWRVAHLSDIHVVGERYGFRVESGRSGPQGNERFLQAIAKLDAIHTSNPLDLVLITGDITDAGRSSEWAEFFDALAQYPQIARLILALPGNHDLNVVDRANPARLDLPISPKKRFARYARFLRSRPSRVPVFTSWTERRGASDRRWRKHWNHTQPRSLPSPIGVQLAFLFLSRGCGRSCSLWSSHGYRGWIRA